VIANDHNLSVKILTAEVLLNTKVVLMATVNVELRSAILIIANPSHDHQVLLNLHNIMGLNFNKYN